MGPYLAKVEAEWNVFRPSFVPDKTIVGFNEYGSLCGEPLRRYCRERAAELVLLHKPWSITKAFLLKSLGSAHAV